MVNLKKLQKEVYRNKMTKGFNVKNVYQEFCYLQEELTEACRAYRRRLPDLGEELADVAIYLLGLAEILKIDLEKEIKRKVKINKKRKFKYADGVFTRIED